jgi:hypothetical protein
MSDELMGCGTEDGWRMEKGSTCLRLAGRGKEPRWTLSPQISPTEREEREAREERLTGAGRESTNVNERTSDVPIWTSLRLHESVLLKFICTSRKLSTLRPSIRNPLPARVSFINTVSKDEICG